LEFLTDESHACVDLLEGLTTFCNLSEVVVHGIGYFNPCASYHMDKGIAQKIINKVLANTRLKTLKLKSFQTINRCVVFEVSPFNIYQYQCFHPELFQSPSLEHLEAELGKSFEIGLLNLPKARHISIDASMWYGCFYHAQNGNLKKIVDHGCARYVPGPLQCNPLYQYLSRLESFNGIDLAALARQSESGHWLDRLREYALG
jgi:hypothetical protein